MARKFTQTAEFANFICHFGDRELLDFLDEIVLPTFLTPNQVRTYGNARYFLHGVALTQLHIDQQNHPAIVGRFVVDTEIRRAQVFKGGNIVDSPRSMETAPSALFALLLDNHKLLYAKEVPGGPGIAAFRTTLERLMQKTRHDYIEALYAEAQRRQESGESGHVSRKTLYESIPKPDLEIVPLLGEAGLKDFLSRFSVLSELRIRVLKPNSEIDNDGLFDDLQRARENVNAESTTLVHRNSEGLKKDKAAKQAAPAMHGNAIVKFVGVGANSERLSGSNEDFKVVSQPISLPVNPVEAGAVMLEVFGGMLKEGLIRIADSAANEKNIQKLKNLFKKQL